MNLQSWDLVSAVSLDAANQQMASRQSELIEKFSLTQEGFKLEGKFDAWKFVGGSQTIAHLEIPIESGSLCKATSSSGNGGEGADLDISVNVPGISVDLNVGEQADDTNKEDSTGDASGKGAIDLAGVSVIVEVSLALLPEPPEKPVGNRLVFDFRTAGKPRGTDAKPSKSSSPSSSSASSSSPAAGVVTPISIHDPKGRLGIAYKSIVQTAVVECLVSNAAKITYNIATIGVIDQKAYGWLKPAHSEYVFIQEANSMRAYLAILSMVNESGTGKRSTNVDPQLFDDKSDGFIAISGNLFLQHVIFPQLPSGIGHGAKPSDFEFVPSKHEIKSIATFGIGKVKVGLINYEPKITSLTVRIEGDKLTCDAKGDCSMGIGIHVTFDVDKNNTLVLESNKQISVVAAPSPPPTHDTHFPWYDYALIAASPLIVGAIEVAIGKALGKKITTSSEVELAADPPAPVAWTGLKKLNVASIQLDTAFLMRGTLSK